MAKHPWLKVSEEMLAERPEFADILRKNSGVEDVTKLCVSLSTKNNLKIELPDKSEIVCQKEYLHYDVSFLADAEFTKKYDDHRPSPLSGIFDFSNVNSIRKAYYSNWGQIHREVTKQISDENNMSITLERRKACIDLRIVAPGLGTHSISYSTIAPQNFTFDALKEALYRALTNKIEAVKLKEKEKFKKAAVKQFKEESVTNWIAKAVQLSCFKNATQIKYGRDFFIVFFHGKQFVLKENMTAYVDDKELIVTDTENPVEFDIRLIDEQKVIEKIRKKLVSQKYICTNISNANLSVVRKYNDFAWPVLNALHEVDKGSMAEIYTSDGNVSFSCSGFDIKDGKVIYKNGNVVKDMHEKRAVSCMEFVRQYLQENHITLELVGSKKQSGLLYGKTHVEVSNGTDTCAVELDPGFYKDSIVKWKKELVKGIKAAISEEQKRKKNEEEAIYTRFYNTIGSYLKMDILEFIKVNEKYITENAVIQAMRGVHIQLNTFIERTPGCGTYNCLPAKMISKAIHDMKNDGLLNFKTLKGTYGDFDIIHLDKENSIIIGKAINVGLTTVRKKRKSDVPINDTEAKTLFDSLNKSTHGYVEALNLLESNPAMVCKHMSEYRSFFADPPKDIKMLMNMKKKECDDITHKLIIQITKKQAP